MAEHEELVGLDQQITLTDGRVTTIRGELSRSGSCTMRLLDRGVKPMKHWVVFPTDPTPSEFPISKADCDYLRGQVVGDENA